AKPERIPASSSLPRRSGSPNFHDEQLAPPISRASPKTIEQNVVSPDWLAWGPCLLATGVMSNYASATLVSKRILSESKCHDPFYCHQSLTWDAEIPQRAYLLKPEIVYDPLPKKWYRNRCLTDLRKAPHELFYLERNPHIYYAGTYICREVRTADKSKISDHILPKIQKEILVLRQATSPEDTEAAREGITKYCDEGQVNLVELVMEYVGFNAQLHGLLAEELAEKEKIKSSKKRKREENAAKAQKRIDRKAL
ncbi:hypothetical protein EIP91_006953, partial [Steccherinum ochraceum]